MGSFSTGIPHCYCCLVIKLKKIWNINGTIIVHKWQHVGSAMVFQQKKQNSNCYFYARPQQVLFSPKLCLLIDERIRFSKTDRVSSEKI